MWQKFLKYFSKFLLVSFNLAISHLAIAQVPATMADYWAGNAKWELVKKRNFNDPAWQFGASTIRVVGNEWYLFSRTNSPNSSCLGGDQLGTQVRKSSDRGETWTTPINVISPTPNTPWACAATDGDAVYDVSNNKWRFLFQCLGSGTGARWKGCYAEKTGNDPMGAFTIAQSPVIEPGALWNIICNTSSDDCFNQSGGANKIFDEGTFNIFRFDGTHYWISFHGTDGVRGYRGIAKTTNFLTYYAGGANGGTGEATPVDAILDKNDGNAWRETWQSPGNIGAGHAPIVQDGGYYYMLAEMADKNLGCTAGQKWDFGLFRSSSLSSTTWEQFPQGNPVIYSSTLVENGTTSLPCNLQYAQIYKDATTNVFYLKYFRSSIDWNFLGNYFYRLVKTSNILKNADLWMANGSYWNRIPVSPTNLAIYRYPNLSPDGTPVMAANCGQTPCAPGQSIYQDVDVTAYRGRSFTFGGQFSAQSGSGSLSLAVFQLDASFNILQRNSIAINAVNGSYTNSTSPSFVISNGAKYLRYQIYLETPLTYLADNMFINLN